MSTEGFDSEISEDLSLKYDAKSNVVSDLIGGTVASVVDFGATVFNSLVPEDREVDTRDLINRVDSNAARIYDEHTDAVQAASFIGGILAPTGLAMKGMSALRNGSKATNWFTTAGKVESEANIAKLFAKGPEATEQFRGAVNSMRAATWGNAAVDSIAAEVAIVGAMNAHPFMEDYMKDPATNFAKSALLGTGIMGGVGHIIDKGVVRGIKSEVEVGAQAIAREGYTYTDNVFGISDQLLTKQNNVRNWEGMLSSTKTADGMGPVRELNDYTKDLISSLLMKERASMVEVFDEAASPAIRALDADAKAGLINLMAEARFQNIDSVSYVMAKEDLPSVVGKVKGMVESTILKPLGIETTNGVQKTLAKDFEIPLVQANKKGVDKGVAMVYSKEFDSFMLLSDYKHFGTAVDFVENEKALLTGVENNWHMLPRYDNVLENTRRTTAAVDADYLRSLKYYDELDIKKFGTGEISVAPDDISALQGIYARYAKEMQANPGIEFKVKLTKEMPKFDKEEKLAGASEVFENLIRQKEASIMEYLQQGVPFETIALHTNVPVGTVKAFAATGQSDLLASGATMRYSTASEIGKYLAPENKALRVQSNVDKTPFARIKANLNGASMDTADHEIRNVMLNNSRSSIARSLGEFLGSDDNRYLKSVLTSGLEQIVNSKVGNKFLTSSDFALRHLEEYGSIVASMGKDVQHQINRQFKALWEPMETSFRTISKDPAATVELNTAINMNAGLKGYREFRDGKFFVQNAETPWKEIKDAAGKVVGKERNMEEALFNGVAFEVKTPAVIEAMKEMQLAGRELYHLKTTMNQMVGRQAISDIGFWVPPFNPRARYVGYVFDKVEDKTMLLHGRTYEELMAAKSAHMETLNPADIGRRYEYIDDKVDQALFNKLQGRHDPVFMGAADSNMLHSGASRTAITNTNADILSDLANGYESYIGYGVRSIVDANSRNILNHFDNISYMVQKPMKDQPLNIVQKFMQAPLDGGKVLRNTYMGVSDLKDSGAWQSVSNITNLGFEYAIKTISSVMEPVLNQGGKLFGKGRSASDADYSQLMKSLEDRGIVNPFQGMSDYTARNMYHVQRMSESPNMTPRILALSNSLASTLMLRVGELAQPYVNAISLPILTSGAMTRKLASSYMGTAVDPNAKFGVVATMYNGIRYGGSMEGQKFIKMGEEAGLFKPIISEATEVLSAANQLKPGAISAIEKGLQSKAVDMLSWGADKSEAVVRRMAFQTGVYMAKEAYPGLKDAGIMTFARNFMDQTIGNYHAAQRPTMFQGTLGMAAGLFQTYMLTMAQQIYRNIEAKEFKALAKMMLAQSSIFGARSLPGFSMVSEYIGEHFSDQHIDLSSGLYRALPDQMANIVLYGLPSNLGPAITTRGEIQPRVPNLLGEGVKAIPAVNMLGQAYASMDKVASAAFSADANTGRAVMEAISMQSISRPIARVSELFTGQGLTQQGNVMYDVKTRNEDGEFEYRAILSRLAATRPLEEVKAREAYHLDSVYKASDRKQNQAVTSKLRTMLRDGDIDDEKLAKLAEEYMRNGTPSGWRSAINTAIAQTSQPASNSVRNYLSSDSPLQMMIDDL